MVFNTEGWGSKRRLRETSGWVGGRYSLAHRSARYLLISASNFERRYRGHLAALDHNDMESRQQVHRQPEILHKAGQNRARRDTLNRGQTGLTVPHRYYPYPSNPETPPPHPETTTATSSLPPLPRRTRPAIQLAHLLYALFEPLARG